MTQDYPKLTITGDVDGDGSDETGVFEMKTADVEPVIAFNPLFATGDGLVQTALAKVTDSERDEIQIDGGTGTRGFAITFDGFENDGTYQWGNDSNQSLTQASATGQAPVSQISILYKWLSAVNIDSENPATLEYGEFAGSGVYSALDVTPVDTVRMRKTRDETSSYQLEMTLRSLTDLQDLQDGVQQLI